MSAAGLSLADLERNDPTARDHGTERRYLCPLPACADHQRPASHRSLSLNAGTGVWHCHRCHESGLLTDYQTDAPKRPAYSANQRPRPSRGLQALATLPPPTPPAQPSSPTDTPPPPAKVPASPIAGAPELRNRQKLPGTPGAEYLSRRGIPEDVARAAHVRYSPAWYGRPGVVFALQDLNGYLVACQTRHIDERTDPKAHSLGEAKAGLFATAGAMDAPALVVTEAPIDALSLAAAGLPAVACCGVALRPWILPACVGRVVLLAFDADDAGDKAYQEWQAMLRPIGARVYRLRPEAGAKDWNELLQTIGTDALRAALERQIAPRLQPWTAPAMPAPMARPCAGPDCTELVADGTYYCPAHDPFGLPDAAALPMRNGYGDA